jgi:hypothetical protein
MRTPSFRALMSPSRARAWSPANAWPLRPQRAGTSEHNPLEGCGNSSRIVVPHERGTRPRSLPSSGRGRVSPSSDLHKLVRGSLVQDHAGLIVNPAAQSADSGQARGRTGMVFAGRGSAPPHLRSPSKSSVELVAPGSPLGGSALPQSPNGATARAQGRRLTDMPACRALRAPASFGATLAHRVSSERVD